MLSVSGVKCNLTLLTTREELVFSVRGVDFGVVERSAWSASRPVALQRFSTLRYFVACVA